MKKTMATLDETLMTSREALAWLRQVDGAVFHSNNQAGEEYNWVAVVRTPPTTSRGGKIIVAFGETLEVAASGAEREWQHLWAKMSRVH